MPNSEAIAAAVAPVADAITSAVPVTVTAPTRRSWYAINKKADNEAEIRIYEDIGLFGVSAKRFADEVEQIEAKTIHVRLNTDGGDAFDGLAIFNTLRAHPANVVIHVDGLAASAGSIVAMSGDEIRMANNAFVMIHEAHGGVFGEAGDMRRYAELLDKMNDAIASTYQGRAGKTRKYWRSRMAEETWLNAEEAKAEGLVDTIDDRETAAQNRFDFKVYNHARDVPENVRRAWEKPQQQNNSPAPEESQRSDPPPATHKETSAMPNDSTTAAPAQTPAAGTGPAQQGNAAPTTPPTITEAENRRQEMVRLNQVAIDGYIGTGRNQGHTAGVTAERERCKQVAEACPGRPDMALNAILAGNSVESVRLAFAAASAAEEHGRVEMEKKDAELARWQALAATGGYPGGVAMGLSGTPEDGGDGDGGPLGADDAKKQAEREWETKPSLKKSFRGKDSYVAIRTAELTGRFRSSVASSQN